MADAGAAVMAAKQAGRATLAGVRASADRIAQMLTELDDERERRNRMVVELVDAGEDRREVATAARVSAKSVCVFLAEYG